MQGEDAMCLECVVKAWDDVLARDDLVPVGVREPLRAVTQITVVSSEAEGPRIRFLLSPEDAIKVIIHPCILDDLELALSCELQVSIKLEVWFT